MTAAAVVSNVQHVKNAIKNFEAAQNKYRQYGAHDTEPDAIFQGILWKTINDKDAVVPQTGEGWELYANSMDCKEAAVALHAACLCVLQAIFACKLKELREVKKYLEDYCWRYN